MRRTTRKCGSRGDAGAKVAKGLPTAVARKYPATFGHRRSMSIPFFINTRFNMVRPLGPDRQDKRGAPTQTPEWLERRFMLFEDFCLPSLKAQTDQDFTWLVLFSDRTPEPWRERIAAIQRDFPAFVPVFTRDGEEQPTRFRTELAQRLGPSATHVITARIDNDDAFHREMVARTRAELAGHDDAFIVYLNGLQVDVDRGVVARLRKPANSFLARIGRIGNGPQPTVLDIYHHDVESTGRSRNIDTHPMWLQVIHSGNLQNELRSGRVLFHADLQRDFGIRPAVRIDVVRSLSAALGHYFWRRPIALMRHFLRRRPA
jgi:Putative rhamnosyl transferase